MKESFKKILAVLIIILFAGFLSSCGNNNGSNGTADTSSLTAFTGNGFTINVDPKWKVIKQTDFYSEIPNETEVAFASPEAFNGFFLNVNVIKEDLKQNYKSVDYGRANINSAAKNLTDYKKIQEATLTVNNNPALLHIFEARLNATSKIIRFIQLYVTDQTKGYIVTGGVLPDTPETTRNLVGAMVTSFKITSTASSNSSN